MNQLLSFSRFRFGFLSMTSLDEGFQERVDIINADLAKGIHDTPIVSFSAYELDSHGNPVNNLDTSPIKGDVVVVNSARHRLETNGVTFEASLNKSPTWRQLAVVANAFLKMTGERNKAYLEGVQLVHVEDRVKYVSLILTS